MSNKLHKRAKLRRVCRKCGVKLVNKPEYGAVCPKCGWTRISYTDYENYREKYEHCENEKVRCKK